MTDADNGVMPENRPSCKSALASERLALLADRVDEAEHADAILGDQINAEMGWKFEPLYMQSMDAALALLPRPLDWRRLTGVGCSVYGSSPAAKAQIRYDGYSDDPARAIVSAYLRYQSALAKKREAGR